MRCMFKDMVLIIVTAGIVESTYTLRFEISKDIPYNLNTGYKGVMVIFAISLPNNSKPTPNI